MILTIRRSTYTTPFFVKVYFSTKQRSFPLLHPILAGECLSEVEHIYHSYPKSDINVFENFSKETYWVTYMYVVTDIENKNIFFFLSRVLGFYSTCCPFCEFFTTNAMVSPLCDLAVPFIPCFSSGQVTCIFQDLPFSFVCLFPVWIPRALTPLALSNFPIRNRVQQISGSL